MKVKNSQITVFHDRIEKKIPSDLPIDLVLEKHRQLVSIGCKAGFRAPVVVDFTNSRIIFEKLELGDSLSSIYRESLVSNSLEQRSLTYSQSIGHILALLHSNWSLPRKQPCEVTDGFEKNVGKLTDQSTLKVCSDRVFLHGDFALNNIFTDGSVLTVLDPMPNYATSFSIAEYGSRYMDIGMHLNSIHRQIGYRSMLQYSRAHLHSLKDEFVKSYEVTSGLKLDAGFAYAVAFATDKAMADRTVSSYSKRKVRSLRSWLVAKSEIKRRARFVLP